MGDALAERRVSVGFEERLATQRVCIRAAPRPTGRDGGGDQAATTRSSPVHRSAVAWRGRRPLTVHRRFDHPYAFEAEDLIEVTREIAARRVSSRLACIDRRRLRAVPRACRRGSAGVWGRPGDELLGW